MTAASRPSRTRRAPGSDPRTHKIRAIMAACNRLGLDEDARRDRIEQVSGQRSLSRLSDGQLGKLLDAFNGGWKAGRTDRPHLGKIKALWWSLYWLGEIDEPGDAALDSFVNRQTGLAALRFVDHRHSASVIEGLKAWAARVGVHWPCPADIRAMELTIPDYSPAHGERVAVIERLAELCADRAMLFPIELARLEIGSRANLHHWSVREMDDAIRFLGRKWRAKMPRRDQKPQAEG